MIRQSYFMWFVGHVYSPESLLPTDSRLPSSSSHPAHPLFLTLLHAPPLQWWTLHTNTKRFRPSKVAARPFEVLAAGAASGIISALPFSPSGGWAPLCTIIVHRPKKTVPYIYTPTRRFRKKSSSPSKSFSIKIPSIWDIRKKSTMNGICLLLVSVLGGKERN